MDNEHKIEYEGYTITLVRGARKFWRVTATKEGMPYIRIKDVDRDKAVDEVQYLIDLRVAAEDPSVQISKKGFWDWLEK